ncbi:MAG: CRISPR-associated protein [Candidatus Lokiarchaeota archaeon]|nr:CRISPR-associated protein [Candidatus Lokiarchaeota archaeon]
MIYDFYGKYQIKQKEDLENLTNGSEKYSDIKDIYSRILLLSTIFSVEGKWRDYRNRSQKINPQAAAKAGDRNFKVGLLELIKKEYKNYISKQYEIFNRLNLNPIPDIKNLPVGSSIIQFPMVLKRSYISKDDEPLYIIENPIRKEKIFKIPCISAMSWKGNLRWTMMKIHLENIINNPLLFAEKRFRHTLLFGTEKGLGDEMKGWSNYLNHICPKAQNLYLDKLKDKFYTKNIPPLKGMLSFYPTFWDKIDLEVINPHDRENKIGTNPIYYEVVPKESIGFFSILYFPNYWLEQSEKNHEIRIRNDLKMTIEGIKEMMLKYGFSAKKSNDYGLIKKNWDKGKSLLIIKGFTEKERFSNFTELENLLKEVNKGGSK